jgi:hypothetical protein
MLFVDFKKCVSKLVLQSVGADGIFQHGEAKRVGPNLIDGSTGLGAKLKEQGGGKQASLNAID